MQLVWFLCVIFVILYLLDVYVCPLQELKILFSSFNYIGGYRVRKDLKGVLVGKLMPRQK